ncbi:MAG: DUF1585 domain-containing protein [Pseudomonadota bacterium]|nr:DUF1585 domain-containing protein [Pseudomonadota bacterium]
MTLLLALACAGPDDEVPVEPAGPEPLAPVAALSRISLDLRGRRPTEDEILQVEADPAALAPLTETFLVDAGFGERLVTWYADVYRTRTDAFVVGADGNAEFLDDASRLAFLRSVGEEPLRIIQRIADDDLPYTTLVTADWTMTDDSLLRSLPLEAIEDGEGWRKARYTDSRPAAGVLAANGLWWRYTTTIENVNRGRAEAVARYILCDDRYDQPVEFRTSTDVLDSAELHDRVQTDEACISCHTALDPLGSFFFGFYRNHPESFSEALLYYPGRENLWEEMTGVAPAFYGTPGNTLYDLGQLIAGDPRFPNCAVEQGFTFLMGRAPTIADTDRVTAAREAFLTEGLTLRALYRELVADPRYLSIDETVSGVVSLKRMGPDLLASSVQALTGFRWTYRGLDMLTTDAYGVRVLDGGADGAIVTQPATDHATTTVLTQERLAEAAAAYAVANEATLAVADRTLFREVEPGAAATEDQLATQIRALILRAHGRRVEADDADVVSLAALWQEVEAEGGDPSRAWAVVLTALLRHPAFLQY